MKKIMVALLMAGVSAGVLAEDVRVAVPSLVARSSRRILESPMAQAIGLF